MENNVNPPPGLVLLTRYTKKPITADSKTLTMVTFACSFLFPYKKIEMALKQALKASVIKVPVELLPVISKELGVGV